MAFGSVGVAGWAMVYARRQTEIADMAFTESRRAATAGEKSADAADIAAREANRSADAAEESNRIAALSSGCGRAVNVPGELFVKWDGQSKWKAVPLRRRPPTALAVRARRQRLRLPPSSSRSADRSPGTGRTTASTSTTASGRPTATRVDRAWRLWHMSATPRADAGAMLPGLIRDGRRALRTLERRRPRRGAIGGPTVAVVAGVVPRVRTTAGLARHTRRAAHWYRRKRRVDEVSSARTIAGGRTGHAWRSAQRA